MVAGHYSLTGVWLLAVVGIGLTPLVDPRPYDRTMVLVVILDIFCR